MLSDNEGTHRFPSTFASQFCKHIFDYDIGASVQYSAKFCLKDLTWSEDTTTCAM